MPLGANIVPMIPHSMLRIEAMGLERAISEEPTEEDLQKMVSEAVEDARATLSDHRSTFDDRVCEKTLSRTIG